MPVVKLTKDVPVTGLHFAGKMRKAGDIFEANSSWIKNMRKSHPEWIVIVSVSDLTADDLQKLKRPGGENKVAPLKGENKAKKDK